MPTQITHSIYNLHAVKHSISRTWLVTRNGDRVLILMMYLTQHLISEFIYLCVLCMHMHLCKYICGDLWLWSLKHTI